MVRIHLILRILFRFVDDEACIRVQNEDELLDAIELFSGDSNIANQYASRAKKVVEANKGSTEIQASYIINQLGEKN